MRQLVAELVARAAVGRGATVVDYGCGDQPYRSLLDSYDYIGVDLPQNERAAVGIRPDGGVPLPDQCADLILSTQVLEHVTDPVVYLSECRRLLRPGGTLLLSTHGVMYFHPHPTDYWRWTHDGLRLSLDRAGFAVVEQQGVLTLPAASLQLVQHYCLEKTPAILHRPICAVLQALIACVDRCGSDADRRSDGFVIAVRAVRPDRRTGVGSGSSESATSVPA